MDIRQKSIRVLRQLDAEDSLLQQLKQVCDEFSELVTASQSAPIYEVELKPAENRLGQFSENAKSVINGRKKLLEIVSADPSQPVSIRQFIRTAPEPMRSELDSKRNKLIERAHELKVQISGDSAVLYYAFDFYRRIVNGLVNCVAEEQPYSGDGKSAPKPSGKLIQRTC